MPTGMQAKLLRALQERTVRPVGGDEEIAFDARIVAATNRDLEHEVAEGRFREDLYYRINVVRVDAAAAARARARHPDARHALPRALPAARAARHRVHRRRRRRDALVLWPGNVRELQNCIERAVALAMFDHLRLEDLPDKMRSNLRRTPRAEAGNPQQLITAAELERRYISHVMATVKGNKTVAARILGLDCRTVYRKLCPPPPEATPER